MSDFYNKQASGAGGILVETGTTAQTGDFCEILLLADTNFGVLTESRADALGDTMTGFVIPAGIVLKGKFSAFTLTSGKVRAMKSLPIG